ncbi:hypothetical protein K1F50_20425 [Muricauda oceani]|uniref:Uncharacterized protein n=1 Tax=Flagellimonas oceani TaxID=2698672 RepID=A0A6G7IZ50_9FLAO|nr:hypothetical protein [Allomuricauda oceani]MBW8245182.1 hypothetical protein [Allomuricauda oceani]QII43826.1 hypothetical protein GVT53_03760 [Allomuricauda oceani]
MEYQSKGRKFFIDYLPKVVFNGFTKEERSTYSKYRHHHLKYHRQIQEVEELESQLEELKSLIGEKKSSIKRYQKELFKHFDKVKHLGKELDFNSWVEVEWRNKKKCKENPNLEPNKRVVVMIQYKLGTDYKKKKISCGPWEEIPEILNQYKNRNKDYSTVGEDDLRLDIQWGFVDGYTKYHLYKNGYLEFHNTPHNLKGVIEWFNQYDEEYGKRKSMEWSYMDYN